MRPVWMCMAVAIAIAVSVTSLFSRATGIYKTGITRSMPSCGECHRSSPGSAQGMPKINVALSPAQRSLSPGQATTVSLSATGGQQASPLGGFAVDATDGAFAAGSGSRVQGGGAAISHSRPGTRSWSFGYTAPGTPGLVEMFGVVNTVDADGKDDDDDMWAFHGFDPTSRTSTPVRLYVNAPGVSARGSACAGSFGNVPVLGADVSATVGSATFAVALHGAAPSAPVVLAIGADPTFQLDLSIIGVTGCTLYVNPALSLPSATSGGSAQRGEGAARIGVPIPNNPALRGAALQLQAIVVDAANGRRLPLTLTNALAVQIL